MSNKYKFIISSNTKNIDIPIEIKWDFYGKEDSIELYEDEVLEEIIGLPKDYEISRFSHDEYGIDQESSIEYKFHFFDGVSVDIPTSVISDWKISYLSAGFSVDEVYFKTNPFKKSFFKLDFYDTLDSKTQKNYFTTILSTNSEFTENVLYNPLLLSFVDIDISQYKLDYVFKKEGFFIYWLRDFNILRLNEFYMTAKFFDAKNGVFVKMMTTPQSNLTGNKFTFGIEDYFYYKVVLDYNNFTYELYDTVTNLRVGNGTPINWYEYVNPPQI